MPCDPSREAPLDRLASLLRGRVCVVGIGNPLKGDDGAGPEVIRRLRGRTRAACIDAGVAPENHLERVVRMDPEVVLLVDILDFGEAPGRMCLAEGSRAEGGGLSSHALPLHVISDYFQSRIGLEPLLLGIQPASVALGHPLSEPVAAAVRRIADGIAHALPPVV